MNPAHRLVCVLTLLAQDLNNMIMGVPQISKEELKAQLDADDGSGPIVVDVRLKYPYEHSTVKIPGAIRLAPQKINLSKLPTDRNIVVYDSDPEDIVSESVVAVLNKRGYRASSLTGGILEWMTAKLPTEGKHAPKQAPPKAGALKG